MESSKNDVLIFLGQRKLRGTHKLWKSSKDFFHCKQFRVKDIVTTFIVSDVWNFVLLTNTSVIVQKNYSERKQ